MLWLSEGKKGRMRHSTVQNSSNKGLCHYKANLHGKVRYNSQKFACSKAIGKSNLWLTVIGGPMCAVAMIRFIDILRLRGLIVIP